MGSGAHSQVWVVIIDVFMPPMTCRAWAPCLRKLSEPTPTRCSILCQAQPGNISSEQAQCHAGHGSSLKLSVRRQEGERACQASLYGYAWAVCMLHT